MYARQAYAIYGEVASGAGYGYGVTGSVTGGNGGGRAYGVMGIAGGATDGYNCGVTGLLTDHNGAAIVGVLSGMNNLTQPIPGMWAGWFEGNVNINGQLKITGGLTGAGGTPAAGKVLLNILARLPWGILLFTIMAPTLALVRHLRA